MINKITGEHIVDIHGVKYKLRFDWAALASIEQACGDNPNFFNPDAVAKIASIGMAKYHAEMTAEKIKELSPPLVPFAGAVQEALQYAYFGINPVPDKSEIKKKHGQKTDGLLRRMFRRRRPA